MSELDLNHFVGTFPIHGIRPSHHFSPPASGETHSVLIADDNPGVRDLVTIFLTRAGYDVVTVADGGEAVRTLRERSFSVVLTDLTMPFLDGFAVLHEARVRQIPSALMSGGAGALQPWDWEERANAAGACATLKKPFLWPRLLDVLRAAENSVAMRRNHLDTTGDRNASRIEATFTSRRDSKSSAPLAAICRR